MTDSIQGTWYSLLQQNELLYSVLTDGSCSSTKANGFLKKVGKRFEEQGAKSGTKFTTTESLSSFEWIINDCLGSGSVNTQNTDREEETKVGKA